MAGRWGGRAVGAGVLAVMAVGCGTPAPKRVAVGVPDEPTAAAVADAMDPAVDPCRDFWRYACGGWIDRTPIPPDEARWFRSFSEVQQRNREVLRAVMEEAANAGGDADRQRVGAFWASCMDEPAIEAAGARPLEPALGTIAAMTDPAALMTIVGLLQREGVPALFSLGVGPDPRDPSRVIASVGQGGLGLPDREYYMGSDPRTRQILPVYERHVAGMLTLLGDAPGDAVRSARRILSLESQLARAARPRAALRDPEATYHRVDRATLAGLAPILDWDGYFAAAGYPRIRDINVTTPEYFRALERIVRSTPPDVWRDYLRWALVRTRASQLPATFDQANFAFYGTFLSGRREQPPRWKRCVDTTSAGLEDLVGKLYVARAFSPESRAAAREMVDDVTAAFDELLPGVAWMDAATRAVALGKALAVNKKIGYPDTLRDYARLRLRPTAYYDNFVAVSTFDFDDELARVGGPTDRARWELGPQVVNAYYNPVLNEIVFPAGILQPPFFEEPRHPALNYGAIGAVVGHELTHGFDDQGRKYDAQGVLRPWWAPQVAQGFVQAAACVNTAWSAYEIEPGLHVNGPLTLGEDIADLAGVKLAHRAYDLRRARGVPPSPVPGLTDEQLFFVAYAQVWCSVATPEAERMLALTDPHAPARVRVLATLAHTPSFAEAFQCRAGAPMRANPVCTVW
ncbi:MAG: M13 family metallopeptidase [bacterium]|nr:M13 family metallopeptidase [bacterium]